MKLYLNYCIKISKGLILSSLFFSLTTIQSIYADCTYQQEIQLETFAMGNMLTWSTLSEKNNKAFVIEKSEDGVTYQSIGRVKGAGTTSTLKKYRFLDVAAAKGANFYRLKQLNKDKSFKYSKTISIKKETGNNFTIVSMTSPDSDNPVFELTVNAVADEAMNYTIYDMEGNPIYTQKQRLKKGINIISVDIEAVGTQIMGFASTERLGRDVPYKITLKGTEEVETLTIGHSDSDKKSKKTIKR